MARSEFARVVSMTNVMGDMNQLEALSKTEAQTNSRPGPFQPPEPVLTVQMAVELAKVAQVTLTSRRPVRFLPQRPWGWDVHFWMGLLGVDRLAWPSLWQRMKSNPVLDAGPYQAAMATSRPGWRPLFERLTPQSVMWTNGQAEAVDTIIMATGYQFQPEYLSDLPVCDEQGQVWHRRGNSVSVPGLFFLGLSYQRTYASATLRGAGPDAAVVVRQI